jgi:hypothetical protein
LALSGALAGALVGPIAAASAAAGPTVSSLRAGRGTVTIRVSRPTSVRVSIYEATPAGCRKPYCRATLVTATTQKVGRHGLKIAFGRALPPGRYLVVAVAVARHGYVSAPRYASVTAS